MVFETDDLLMVNGLEQKKKKKKKCKAINREKSGKKFSSCFYISIK